ncbi:hypothetical protein NDU88_011711 [Pleurodeles waltl]|uniref:Uncharacterized protein n=1 Tax=Pleurodeles waltl TaxID=8319 RepID=A0AAV7QY40_PLEWA|nr:hypothetical protein NDU88_011711 [Pleurodeles waltl]
MDVEDTGRAGFDFDPEMEGLQSSSINVAKATPPDGDQQESSEQSDDPRTDTNTRGAWLVAERRRPPFSELRDGGGRQGVQGNNISTKDYRVQTVLLQSKTDGDKLVIALRT